MQSQPLQAFNVFTTFAYLGLAMSIMGAVASVQMEVTASEPVSGRDLANAIAPVVQSLQALYPKLSITPDLVLACCDAVAVVLNERRTAGA